MLDEEKRELTVPFGGGWYRCESCEPKKRKDGWVLHYSGKVTPYEVDFETYKDFLNLKRLLSKDLVEKPRDDVVEFFRKWGPLGLWQRDFVEASFRPGVGLQAHTSWMGHPMGDEPFEEYWMRNHARKLRINLKDYPAKMPSYDFIKKLLSADNVFKDYFETWTTVFGELFLLKQLDTFKTHDIIDTAVNVELHYHPLKPVFVKTPGKPKKYEWAFSFKTLSGAMVGLLAQEVIGKVDMRECKNCGTRFDAIETGRSTFCTNRCRVEYPDKQKREDPVIKYRRMLQRRLERRPEVSDKKSRSINNELLTAKSVDALKVIEEEYPVVLGKKKGGAT